MNRFCVCGNMLVNDVELSTSECRSCWEKRNDRAVRGPVVKPQPVDHESIVDRMAGRLRSIELPTDAVSRTEVMPCTGFLHFDFCK